MPTEQEAKAVQEKLERQFGDNEECMYGFGSMQKRFVGTDSEAAVRHNFDLIRERGEDPFDWCVVAYVLPDVTVELPDEVDGVKIYIEIWPLLEPQSSE